MGEEDTQEEQINAFRDRIRPMIAELESIAGHLPPNEFVDPFKLLHKHLLSLSLPHFLICLPPAPAAQIGCLAFDLPFWIACRKAYMRRTITSHVLNEWKAKCWVLRRNTLHRWDSLHGLP